MGQVNIDQIMVLARIFIAALILCITAYKDIQTRKAENIFWIILGFGGFCLLSIDIFRFSSELITVVAVIPSIVLLGLMFVGFPELREVIRGSRDDVLWFLLSVIGLISFLLATYFLFFTSSSLSGDARDLTVHIYAIPVLMLVFLLLYYTRLIQGGADAKALMALAVVFPTYPVLGGFPYLSLPTEWGQQIMETMFPFAFVVLFNSALLLVMYPLVLFFYNLSKKDLGFPIMFVGYRMDLSMVSRSHVWLLERADEEGRYFIFFPKREGDTLEEIKKLRKDGAKMVWVTYKIPFLVPMAAGLILSVIVGNLMLLVTMIFIPTG